MLVYLQLWLGLGSHNEIKYFLDTIQSAGISIQTQIWGCASHAASMMRALQYLHIFPYTHVYHPHMHVHAHTCTHEISWLPYQLPEPPVLSIVPVIARLSSSSCHTACNRHVTSVSYIAAVSAQTKRSWAHYHSMCLVAANAAPV